MYSSFAERTEITSKITNDIHPFYENEGISFYKNKLIRIEDAIEQKEVDRGNAADFQSFEMKVYHILTFKDEMGNTHEYQSTIKPKNVGSIMYYAVEDGKIKDVFSESDKERFKKYIYIKKEYKNPNKIYRFTQFLFRSDSHVITLLSCGWFLFSTLIYWSGYFGYSPKDGPFAASLLFGGFCTVFVFIGLVLFDIVFDRKVEKNIQKKRNEEKDAILKTFI